MAKEGRPEAWCKLTGKRWRSKKVWKRGEAPPHILARLAHEDAKLIRKLLPIELRRKPHDAFWLAAKYRGADPDLARRAKKSGKRRR